MCKLRNVSLAIGFLVSVNPRVAVMCVEECTRINIGFGLPVVLLNSQTSGFGAINHYREMFMVCNWSLNRSFK